MPIERNEYARCAAVGTHRGIGHKHIHTVGTGTGTAHTHEQTAAPTSIARAHALTHARRYNYAATLTGLGSKTCTQSTDARCTTAALTALVGLYSSVMAAYCNEQYLVRFVHSFNAPFA